MAHSHTVPLMSDVEGGEIMMEEGAESSESGIKEDFAYHNNVAGAAKVIRLGFIRKVYGLLSVQLGITTLIAGVCLFTPSIRDAVHVHPEFVLVAFLLSLGLLLALHLKRREFPINLVLLAAFTVVEAYTVGVLVTFYDAAIVVQAFFLTASVVVVLTAYTFQSKRDFSNWGAGLFAGLWILILSGFILSLTGSAFADTLMAAFGALLFSGFIIFDTHMIMTRVSPEEYIMATIELYLDIINLFIEILKILEKVNRK